MSVRRPAWLLISKPYTLLQHVPHKEHAQGGAHCNLPQKDGLPTADQVSRRVLKHILGVARPHPVIIVVNLVKVQVCQIVIASCLLQVGIAPKVGQGVAPAIARKALMITPRTLRPCRYTAKLLPYPFPP